jgi:hypothetical protein
MEMDPEAMRDLAAFHQRNIHHKERMAGEASDDKSHLPQCPYCGGRLEGQFPLCMHCQSVLSWVDGVPWRCGLNAIRAYLRSLGLFLPNPSRGSRR